MTKAVVIHGALEGAGGAEAYCVRVVEILQHRFDEVLVLYMGAEQDIAKLETWFGVQLDRRKVRFEAMPENGLVRFLSTVSKTRLMLISYGLLMRHARKHVKDAELVMTTWSELPLQAKRSIQTVQIPQYVTDAESLYYTSGRHMGRTRRVFWSVYMLFVKLLVGFNRKTIGNHLTIANSVWSAGQFRRHYPARDVRPFYFGVDFTLTPDSADWVPFENRENNLVIIGRVAPMKHTGDAIEIVERLRGLGHDVGLHLVGQCNDPYAAELREASATRPWITWHTNLDRAQLLAQVGRQKWGIHCCHYEHYGFAPAELQGLGCITFIHDSGGQREIIRNPTQRYVDTEDAVRKIDAIMRAPDTHGALLAEEKASAELHTTEGFRRDFRALLEEVMAEPADKSAL